jgi:hypothetical protein
MPELNPNGASDTDVKPDDGNDEMNRHGMGRDVFRTWPVMNR